MIAKTKKNTPVKETKAVKAPSVASVVTNTDTEDSKVQVSRLALEEAWKLIHTREWPMSMMFELATVKLAFSEAIYGKVSNEAQGANKA